MKKSEKKTKIKVKPRRITRAERKKIKQAQKAREELQLCTQAAEFHKAYLAVQLGCEQERFDEIQARLAALNPEVETTETIETIETVETVENTKTTEPQKTVQTTQKAELAETSQPEKTTEQAKEVETPTQTEENEVAAEKNR